MEPYVEDGVVGAKENDGGVERVVVGVVGQDGQPPPAMTNWTWIVFAAAAGVAVAAATGGLIAAYCLYRKMSKVEQKLEATARDAATTAADVLAVHKKLVDTQTFIVEMAQRKKWPWPFNNRIQGLEQEFGLPTSK